MSKVLPGPSPAQQCLKLVRNRLNVIHREVPGMIDMGKRMAKDLLAGGRIVTPGIWMFWPHEFTGRAVGMMGVGYGRRPKNKGDLGILHAQLSRGTDEPAP